MNLLEIFATAATALCVVLAVRRSLFQFPVGALSGCLYAVVFHEAGLNASALLQVFFIFTQVYGLWYWLRGEAGARPPIRSLGAGRAAALSALAAIMAAGAIRLGGPGDADWVAYADAGVLCLSVLAQILLDRKRLENWFVWMAVNVLATAVYASQELWLTSALYLAFFFNAFWGYYEWRREWRTLSSSARTEAWL